MRSIAVASTSPGQALPVRRVAPGPSAQLEAWRLLFASTGHPVEEPARRRIEDRTGVPLGEARIHNDAGANLAAFLLGAYAFTLGNHIYLGPTLSTPAGPSREAAVDHELVHVAQVRLGHATTRYAPADWVEREAHTLAGTDSEAEGVAYGASADTVYGFWWLIPVLAGAYVLLRPNVANAPQSPQTPTQPSVSEAQVAGEALALFLVPEMIGGGAVAGGATGWRLYRTLALAGAAGNVSYQGVQDIGRGRFAGVGTYAWQSGTGAAFGLAGAGGISGLDWLATRGLLRSDLAMTRALAEAGPVSGEELTPFLQPQGWTGRASQSWLNQRSLALLYRGQEIPVEPILSPLARSEGVAASEALVARMRAAGLTDAEIAQYTAQWHVQPVPPQFTLPELANEPLGAAGIPTTRIPGVAAGIEGVQPQGMVYVIRVPRGTAIPVPQWGLSVENEFVILNQLPPGSVVQVMPASSVPGLTVDKLGQLVRAPAVGPAP